MFSPTPQVCFFFLLKTLEICYEFLISRVLRYLTWAIFANFSFLLWGREKFPCVEGKWQVLTCSFFAETTFSDSFKSPGAGAASAVSQKNTRKQPSQSCLGQSEKIPRDRRTEICVLVLVHCPCSISWPLPVLAFNLNRKVSSRLVPLTSF